jgi:hypothetical protein
MKYVNAGVVYLVTLFWLTLIQGLPLTMEVYSIAITACIAVLTSSLLVSNLIAWSLLYVLISGMTPEEVQRFKEITCIAFGVGGA